MMKYLDKLSQIKVFNFNDLFKLIGDENLSRYILKSYLEKGYITRIKHNLYGVISFESGDCLADKFFIASRLTNTSFVSHHSAFEFYNHYNQIYTEITVSSVSKFNDFEFEGNNFKFIKTLTDNFVVETHGVRVSTIERTIVDCIKDSGKYCDLEETLNSIDSLSYVDSKIILDYLFEINSKMLFKKVGLVLSLFKDKVFIPETFFETCHKISDSIIGHFDHNKIAHYYNSEWKIYVYKDLERYIQKY